MPYPLLKTVKKLNALKKTTPIKSIKIKPGTPQSFFKENTFFNGLKKKFEQDLFVQPNHYDTTKFSATKWQLELHHLKYQVGLAPEKPFIEPCLIENMPKRHTIKHNTQVFKHFIQEHRNGNLYSIIDVLKAYIQVFKDAFPEYADFNEKDFLLTCSPQQTRALRKIIFKALREKPEQLAKTMKQQTQRLFQQWSEKKSVTITQDCNMLAAKIIATHLLGDEKIAEQFDESLEFTREYLIAKITKSVTPELEKTYKQQIKVIRKTIEYAADSRSGTLFSQILEGHKEKQIKALLLVITQAGRSTTGHALVSLIQDYAVSEKKPASTLSILEKSTPVPHIGRTLKEDITLEIEYINRWGFTRVQRYPMKKGEEIAGMVCHLKKYLFGVGKHRCPGEQMTHQILNTVMDELDGYHWKRLSPTPAQANRIKGGFTATWETDPTICVIKKEEHELTTQPQQRDMLN